MKKGKVSYNQVEKLVLYLEAEAQWSPTNLHDTNGNVRSSITLDFQKLLATFEELLKLVQEVEIIKENGLIDRLAAVDSQYQRYD